MDISLRTAAGRWLLAACILVSGLGFLESSAVNIALPTIQNQFGSDFSTIQWIADAYLLALSSLILISGSIGDRLGRKRIYATGIIIFSLGTLLDGLAPTAGALIGFRALQGIGAALMIPGSLAVINSLFPDSERGRAIGLWAGVSGAISAIGPFIGGFLVSESWRLLFFAITPLGIASWAVVLKFVPADDKSDGSSAAGDESTSRIHRGGLSRLDWPGTALIVIGLGLLSFGLIRIPDHGTSATVAASIIAGGAGIVGFFVRQRFASEPLVPPGLFSATVLGANLATVSLYFALSGVIFLLSFDLQQLLGMSSTVAGLALLPTTILIALLSGPSGSVTDRLGPRPQMIVGPLVVAAGFALFLIPNGSSGYFPIFPIGLGLIGIGMAIVIPAITTSALEVERRMSGTASGVNNAAARVAGFLAIVVVGGVLSGVFTERLRAGIGAVAIDEPARLAILADASKLLALKIPASISETQKSAVELLLRSSYVAAFRWAVAVNVLLSAAASLFSVFLISRRRSRSEGGESSPRSSGPGGGGNAE